MVFLFMGTNMSSASKNNLRKKNSAMSSNGKKKKTTRLSNTALVYTDRETIMRDNTPRPWRINPESDEEREKRLAKRKKLTLKAFQAAYENYQSQKVK